MGRRDMMNRVALARMNSNKAAERAGHEDRTVVITRPERSADRAAAFLSGPGTCRFEILVSPLLTIVPMAPEIDLSDFAAVVLTSENAVLFTDFSNMPKQMPAYCIGEGTAAAAAEAGFSARAAENSSDSLISLAVREHALGKLLYLRGRHAANDVAGMLDQAGLPSEEVIVYDQVPANLNAAARKALIQRRCVFPVFSPRTAEILADEAEFAPDIGHTICCLSTKVANAFRLNWNCTVAPEPTLASILRMTRDVAAGPAA